MCIRDSDGPLQKGHSLQTDLLLSALENFHYSVLDMKLRNIDEDNLEVKLHVKGNNPELYDGQTIELNVNLTGNLLDVARSGLQFYTLPERLEEQLTQ